MLYFILSITKLLISFVGIPLSSSSYLTEISRLRSLPTPLPKHHAWVIKNKYFYMTSALLIIGIGVDLDANQNFRFMRELVNDKNNPLKTFSLQDYERELNMHEDSLTRQEKNTLKRKFQQAKLFEKIGDLENAKKHYISLLDGKDEHGDIQLINSFIIHNNLGIIHFKEKRNKKFESFIFMQNAFEISKNDHYKSLTTIEDYKKVIKNNINVLDNLVNYID